MFVFSQDGSNPDSQLNVSDGVFLGTSSGGFFGNGTVYTVSSSGDFRTLHSFSGLADGAVPQRTRLAGDGAGNFYGECSFRGSHDHGVIYRIDSRGQLTVVYSFAGTDGDNPEGGLIRSSDGNFYGVTNAGGAANSGTVFKVSTAGVLTTLHSFGGGADGSFPDAGLIQGADGNFYGTTNAGGTGSGTIFSITPAGSLTTLYTFSDASTSKGRLIAGASGEFFGSTYDGGANARGSVFKVTALGTYTLLYSFTGGTDGSFADADLVVGSDGRLFGTTSAGGANSSGTAFAITTSGAFTLLHAFNAAVDGSDPTSLALANDGNFYGTTYNGGANGLGTVFKMTASGTVTTLHDFAGAPLGSNPLRELLFASDGNYYGTTLTGGSLNLGVVYRMTPAGAVTVLHAFRGAPDGSQPFAKLLQAADGDLYGTTEGGGANDRGTIFKVSLAGTFTLVHSFGGADGDRPEAGLAQGEDGRLYGSTASGGTDGFGTVFASTLTGVVTVLHNFAGTDGAQPYAPLLRASDGLFYGSTAVGGTAGLGTLFKVSATGTFTSLHSFLAGEGNNPRAALLEASDGNFYGTTRDGGTAGDGVIYRLSPSGTVATVHDFTGPDGRVVDSPLVQASDGKLYGTTAFGGAYDQGTIFRFLTAGSFKTLYHFTGGLDGGEPSAGLTLQTDGSFLGASFIGGPDGAGSIFRFSVTSAQNIATRLQVGDGDELAIGGFIITGTGPKKVILRGIGPSLAVNGTPVDGRLSDPTLELRFQATGVLIGANDDWQTDQRQEIIDSTVPPTDDRESAIVATLDPGAYTALLRGKNGAVGIGVVEAYDLDSPSASSFGNIATRGKVLGGDQVMIGGFIVSGPAPTQILVRGIGPELMAAGVAGALDDPTLELYDATGTKLAMNDDWQTDQPAEIAATGLAPTDAKEAAILQTLAGGAYTAVLRGKNDTIGVALVEVYVLQ